MSFKVRPFILPVISLSTYLGLAFYIKMMLPPGTDIYSEFESFFRQYGYYLIFISAILEAALVINLVVPGASVLLAGAFFASQGVVSYPILFIVTLIGSIIGFLIDYYLGYFGEAGVLKKVGLSKQLEIAERRVKKWGWKAFLFGYIHPDLGSLYAVAAGVLKVDLKLFIWYTIIALTFWGAFWTLPIYFFGDVIKQYFQQYIVLGIIIVVGAIFLPKIVATLKAKFAK